jgi:hypothetical protein
VGAAGMKLCVVNVSALEALRRCNVELVMGLKAAWFGRFKRDEVTFASATEVSLVIFQGRLSIA